FSSSVVLITSLTVLYSLSLHDALPILISFAILFSTVGFSFFLLFIAIKGTAESLVHQAPIYQERLTAQLLELRSFAAQRGVPAEDRKSTRLNSSHVSSSYAVSCLKKTT